MITSLESAPGILRKCLRCGHHECPFCGDFCDASIDDEGPEANAICARELACIYESPGKNAAVEAFMARVREVFGDTGFSVGEKEDGGLWAEKGRSGLVIAYGGGEKP